MNLRKIRIFSQILFFFLFIVQVFLGILISNEIISKNFFSSFFFYIDPLLLFHSLVALFVTFFLISIPFLLLSIFFRRFFCGWICPLGTTIRFFSKSGLGRFSLKYRNAKLFFLFSFLFLTLSGVTFLFLDPITLLYRFFSSFFYPLILNSTLLFFKILKISPPGTFLKFFPAKEIFILHSFSIFVFLLIIVLLNLVEKNFWCKYVCPLGGLFSIFSSLKYGIYLKKDVEKCIKCNRCQAVCSMDVNPICGKDWENFDCIICFNCVNFCPTKALEFKFVKNFEGKSSFDVKKRNTIKYLLKVSGTFFLSGFLLKNVNKIKSRVIRPPGSLKEEKFLETCIRCGECVNVCPTNFLQPSLFEASFDGIYTPMGVPAYGFCEDKCVRCSEVCPSGAIRPITVSEKLSKPIKIGTAYIDKNRCIPWSEGKSCIVCEEVCPAIGGEKAIKLKTKEVPGTKKSDRHRLLVPQVDLNLCIGCGICENRCPKSPPAIIVKPEGETRF